MSVKKILLLTGDYAEDYETMVPFQMLTMVGHEVHAVCPEKKKGEKVITAVHDFEGDQTYSEKRGHFFELNATFAEIDPTTYDALVLAGGRAPEYTRLDQNVIACVKHFGEAKKPIAAVCHGIQLLTAAGVVKDRTLTAYPAVGPEVVMAGGKFEAVTVDETVVDENLVTAPAWPAHPKWMKAFLDVLGTKIEP